MVSVAVLSMHSPLSRLLIVSVFENPGYGRDLHMPINVSSCESFSPEIWEILTTFAFSINHLTIFVCSCKFSWPWKFFLPENFVKFFPFTRKNSLSPIKNGDVHVGDYLFKSFGKLLKSPFWWGHCVCAKGSLGCAHGKDHSIKNKHASILPDKWCLCNWLTVRLNNSGEVSSCEVIAILVKFLTDTCTVLRCSHRYKKNECTKKSAMTSPFHPSFLFHFVFVSFFCCCWFPILILRMRCTLTFTF